MPAAAALGAGPPASGLRRSALQQQRPDLAPGVEALLARRAPGQQLNTPGEVLSELGESPPSALSINLTVAFGSTYTQMCLVPPLPKV